MNRKTKTSLLFGWLVCIIGTLFYCYEYLLRIEPSVMVSELMHQFNINAASFGLITALYYYAYTPMQLAVGILIDKYGTRSMLTLAVSACAFGSFLFGISDTIFFAGIARFLIGFGSAFAFVGVLKLAAEWLPMQYFAFFAGFTTSLGMVGGMVGDNGLNSLVHDIGWKGTQNIGTIVGLILIPLIFFFVHDRPRWKNSKGKLNISFGETFYRLQQIFKNPQMWIGGIIGSALYLSLSAFAELWGIKFLQSVYGFSAKQAAFACSMVFVGWLVGGPFCGWLSDRIQSRRKPLIFSGVFSALAIGIVILKPFAIPFSLLCILLLLFGIFASSEVIVFAVSKESNPRHVSATAVAFTNFLVMMSGIIFQPLIGVLLDFGWSGQILDHMRIYDASTYQKAFLVIPFCMIASSLLALKLKETLGIRRRF